MRLFAMSFGRVLLRSPQVGAALAAVVLLAGCGDNYRPVVTPVNTNGPPAQPTSYAVVVTSTGPSTPGVGALIDYSGDSILAEAPLGVGAGPISMTIDEGGDTGHTINYDGTITNFPLTPAQLQPRDETSTTLPSTALPVNTYAPSSGMWISDLNGNAADILTGSPETFTLSVPVGSPTIPAPTPTFIAGAPTTTGQRNYIVSEGFTDPTGLACNNSPTTAPVDGVVTPIEISTHTADAPIVLDPSNPTNSPAGSMNARCPVFAVQTPDLQRLFVLNRGSDTITVINSQTNALDDQCPPPTGCVNQNGQTYFTHPILPLSTAAVAATGVTPPNGTAGMTAVAGPVFAEYNQATQQLVVSNYDGGTISLIDVSLDQYGNDSPTFGTTYTIPVGANPASVTVLYDGTRAYTANQTDGTVTIVNLSSHTVEKTLTVVGHPRTVVSTENSLYGKIYVASPDSPFLTIVESETDLVDTTLLMEGNVMDVRVTTINGTSNSNDLYSSRVPGYGQPCNLPPALMASTYGAGYTLADCQANP